MDFVLPRRIITDLHMRLKQRLIADPRGNPEITPAYRMPTFSALRGSFDLC